MRFGKAVEREGRDALDDLVLRGRPDAARRAAVSDYDNQRAEQKSLSKQVSQADDDSRPALLERAKKLADHCTYFGSAPVPLTAYIESVKKQTLADQHPTEDDLHRAFEDLLIDKSMLIRLGPAINSGRGMFLFGAPGNGKTSIAERITRLMGDTIYVPHAVEANGQIIKVKTVELKLSEKKVEIELGWQRGESARCPECQRECSIHDCAPERTWRHLDTMQFTTLIRARTPRSQCPEHGVKTMPVPWAAPQGRFTLLFERFAVEVLLASASVSQACALLRFAAYIGCVLASFINGGGLWA